jgi:hypothetical protein
LAQVELAAVLLEHQSIQTAAIQFLAVLHQLAVVEVDKTEVQAAQVAVDILEHQVMLELPDKAMLAVRAQRVVRAAQQPMQVAVVGHLTTLAQVVRAAAVTAQTIHRMAHLVQPILVQVAVVDRVGMSRAQVVQV